MTGTKIGEVLVDSGQVMLIDPCYVLHDDFNLGGEPTGGLYDKACRLTTGASLYGEFEGGVVSSTYAGDGAYPVYADLDSDGRVKSITIVFEDDSWYEEDDEDEEEEEDDDEN